MKVLKEENHQEIINRYTKKDWKPLFNMIPRIEKTTSFGKEIGGGLDDDGIYHIPNWSSSKIIYEFLDVAYDIPIIIDFDWSRWDEGRKIAQDESFDYDTIDIPTKCKLITAFVRNDRFCQGALSGAFQRGTILKILKSIERQVQNLFDGT